ncbi:Golgi to ER traffic protein 4 homolog [Cimex lectularius]|uniref:Golgi to ER traffic protein 4 homolog n=1 Tax=Cimex lectularius TaxID=79782 RepID=A0A8I6RPA5_CIMLE|nr:Golgi to ER traffic protein 4 homolog [Cimex lectularius]XP_014248642.1 Golgi to ER traffic protein 4 homolog [Cimex lectularius]XP_014248643.1 Golgi to ER traffic protein 4 homolog [Cimex lectularius]
MAENMASQRGHGVQKVITKIDNLVKNGNYYEAHQMYKSLYFRLLGQKKYDGLLNLLYEGATTLLSHDQQISGIDLANLYIDVLVKSNMKPLDDNIRNLARIFSLISCTLPDRETFLASAVKWSMTGGNRGGSPFLHQLIAEVYWKEKNYTMARRHYLRSYDGLGFGTMLVEVHKTSGYLSEVDLFIAQVVLQCLCLKNKKTAVITFECYTTQHPQISKGPPYLLPLLNFIWFLLQAVEGGRLAAFTVLCEQYQLSIERDPSYSHYLEKIGQLFFGVTPPTYRRPPPTGILGDLFQSLVQSIDDYTTSDDEDVAFTGGQRARPGQRQQQGESSRGRSSRPGASGSNPASPIVMDTELD